MTFYPELGTYSREEFQTADGATLSNVNLQNITGGYVTLVSNHTGSSFIFQTWNDVPNWTFSNNLYNLQSVTGTFSVLSGSISGQVNTVTGSYGITTASNAWAVNTSYPQYVDGFGYSGAGGFGLKLGRGAPDTGIQAYYANGGSQITFEFDLQVTAAYSGLETLAGFSETGNNLTGLPALTGICGHGVLFSNGSFWDYLETTPFGVRSFNHPEIALPLDLINPKRLRFSVRGQDLAIAADDGRSIIALNKFDTPLSSPTGAFVIFGAPTKRTPEAFVSSVLTGMDGSVGESLWDNIKYITEAAIFQSTGDQIIYSTSPVTMYTAPFNPGVSIRKFLYANIGFVPYNGGSTTVGAQYSGVTGWTDFGSVTLSTGNYASIDLSSMPVFAYPRSNFGVDYLSNPIRFKIQQSSTVGRALPPAVEYIEVFADKDKTSIDLLPDWKLNTSYSKIQVAIETGTFLSDDPVPETWSSLLLNVPLTTGVVAGVSFTDESRNIPINVVGSGEFIPGGPYRSCFKNYVEKTLTAFSGTEAYNIFGLTPQQNLFPNPLFSEAFRPITTGELRFVSGLTEGLLAEGTRISASYTGYYKVLYDALPVYRPENQALVSRINSYLGRTNSPGEEYVQSVYVYPTNTTHDGRVGIEALIPSGIATGNLLVSFDIEISKGSGVQVGVSGSSLQSYLIPGDLARTYRSVSLFSSKTNIHGMSISFNIPSGYPGTEYKYNIDNLTVLPIETSYLLVTGMTGMIHTTGLSEDYFTGQTSFGVAERATTITYGSLYLDSYPSSASGILLRAVGQNNRGLELNIDSDGYLNAKVDTISTAWSNSANTKLYENQPTVFLRSTERVPVGVWTNIGFMHDVQAYDKFTYASISGDGAPHNFASTNRALLTINGYPVANTDLMSGWKSHLTTSGDGAPYVSYVDLTGLVTTTLVSGLRCKIDGFHILRPPVADAEYELSIKGARITAPYFVPDQLYSAGKLDTNLAYNGPTNPNVGRDFYVASMYNFSGPGYTHWDRGPVQNHLLFYGSISKENNCPYSGQALNSTRIQAGSYALASYSSAFERINDTTGQLSIIHGAQYFDGLVNGDLGVMGWVYPYTTGSFFTFYQSGSFGNKVELAINSNSRFVANKYGGSNTIIFTTSGHAATTGQWNYFNLRYYQDPVNNIDHTTGGFTGACYFQWADSGSHTNGSSRIFTGIDAGIRYQGRTGTVPSEFRFGGTADIALFNFVIKTPYTGESTLTGMYASDASKSGRYQAMLEHGTLYTGLVSYTGYNHASFLLGPRSGPEEYYFAIAGHNSYDNSPKMNGPLMFDDQPFREVQSYSLTYDTQPLEQVYGATDSPIRLGTQVPRSAVNIARISSPAFTVPSSISSIDLSDRNVNNLITYKDGVYQVGAPYAKDTSVLTGYRGINSAIYSGRVDITITGQVLSSDVEISTTSIINPDGSSAYNAYYYYLVGRGKNAVRLLGAYPHYTGQILDISTGVVPDNYIANLERVKKSIQLKNRKGEILPFDSFPYDVRISNSSPNILLSAISSGRTVYLDNIGGYASGYSLPNEVFSVLLLTQDNRIPDDSVFVHYDAYDLVSTDQIPNFREIVNPQPIFRVRHDLEPKDIGKFDITLNQNGNYDIKLYGIESGYTSKL